MQSSVVEPSCQLGEGKALNTGESSISDIELGCFQFDSDNL